MRFIEVISGWVNRWFHHEEAVILTAVVTLGLLAVVFLGAMLAPVIIALVFAYLLQSLVRRLERAGVPHWGAVQVAFLTFVGAMVAVLLFVLPLVWKQFSGFLNALPNVVAQVQDALRGLPDAYPEYISRAQVETWISVLGDEIGQLGTRALEVSLASLPNVVSVLIYVILVPILVFFFLKDRRVLIGWLGAWLPRSPVLEQVGNEMNAQVANYIRGKIVEIVIVGTVTWLTLLWLGTNYAAFLGLVVGLSVIVPFVGAAVVTIPVALVGFFQYGWSWEFGWLMAAYGIIQALDGNVLVPLLFSEAVDLHPVAIIIAVLLFGGIWGFWGVFFAIPLATLIKAIISAWPKEPTVDPPGEQPEPAGDSAAA